MKKYTYIFASIILTVLVSCSLDRYPDTSYTDDKVLGGINNGDLNSINVLLNGCYGNLKDWGDNMHRIGEYPGDNIMLRGASTDSFFEFISYNHTKTNGRINTFWASSYKTISQTSLIIDNAPKGKSKEIDQKIGEAYFLRGLMYFYLCRIYGRAYYDSPDTNLGVPIVNGMPEDINKMDLPDRSSVSNTYKQAIDDLVKAEELMNQNKSASFATKEAAQGLLSRIYLYMSGTYTNTNINYLNKSIEYAEKVINSGKYQLLDRANFMLYNTFAPDNSTQTETIFAIKRVGTEYSGYDYYYNIGGMYSNINGMGWGEMYASAKYLDLLRKSGAKNDARWTFISPQFVKDADGNKTDVFIFVAPSYTYRTDGSKTLNNYKYIQAELTKNADGSLKQPLETKITEQIGVSTDPNGNLTPIHETKTYILKTKEDGFYYSIDFYGNTYDGEKSYLMVLNRAFPMFYVTKCSLQEGESQLHSPIILRLAEMYLNLAEAHVKKGEYGKALTYLNIIRGRAIKNGEYTSLDASNAPSRVDEERQLELAFEGHRYYDVFRNGQNLTRHYPGAQNNLTEITADNKRTIFYIPQDVINAYGSKLTQNP